VCGKHVVGGPRNGQGESRGHDRLAPIRASIGILTNSMISIKYSGTPVADGRGLKEGSMRRGTVQGAAFGGANTKIYNSEKRANCQFA